jgi:hypothetical protein
LKKKFKAHFVAFLIAQENHTKQLYDYFGQLMYEELQDKFNPWICLWEIDLIVATVSFHGYEVIHQIKKYEKEKHQIKLQAQRPWNSNLTFSRDE